MKTDRYIHGKGHPRCDAAEEYCRQAESRMERMVARLVDVHQKMKRYQNALKRIRQHEGRVCEQYEICEHEACTSSYAAWATADMALSGAEKCIHCSCSPCCSCGERVADPERRS